MIHTHIKEWIGHLSKPQEALGKFSVCPFAKKASYTILEVTDIVNPTEDSDVVIYVFPDELSVEQLYELAKKYNTSYPSFVFLPDHKDKETLIQDVPTNNGKYNLILCQSRTELEKARATLRGTSYYSYWTEQYLAEIMNT